MNRVLRNVTIAGQRTSFRLEQPFWDAALRLARDSEESIDGIFTDIVQQHRSPGSTMSSAVRTFLICRERDKARGRTSQLGAA